MFGTLRYEPQSNNTCYQSGGYSSQHSACDTCRARKLKCGGQKKGCDRCKSTSTKCIYSKVGSSSRRGKHTAASQHSDKFMPSDSSTRSPSNRSSAAQYSQPAKALESPTRAVPGLGLEDGDRMEESMLFSEDDTLFSSFTSPIQSLEDDCIISDHMLHDLLPDLSAQSMEEYLNLPKYRVQTSQNEYIYHPFDAVHTPEHDSMSSDTTYAVSSFTKAMHAPEPARPTSSFPPTASHVQVDRLPSQVQLREEGEARREGASMRTIASPASNTGQQRSQAQSKGWGPLPNDRPQQGVCKCLQSIVGLLEELENRASTTDTHTLDSVLAYHKEALSHCSHMVRCSACRARSDHMILLGVVSDKLIGSYEQVITKHTESVRKRVNDNEEEGGTFSSSSSRSSSSFGAGGEGGGLVQVVSFGCYKIDGPADWDYVIRVLITLQLRQVFELLAQMQHIAEGMSRGPQMSALRTRKHRLKIITAKLGRFGQS